MASDQATESFSNSRRNFIKMAAAGSAVASALSAASATTAQEAAVRLPENEPGPYDLVIAGGRCIDPETGLDGSVFRCRKKAGWTRFLSNQGFSNQTIECCDQGLAC